MIAPVSADGLLHAPYFIFVRSLGRYSAADLLHCLGLSAYRRASSPRLRRHVIFADDGEWAMIADNWSYMLWYMPSTGQAIFQLAQSCDVFACSVGDSDYSFDFEYYREAKLVRRYVVVDPNFRGGEVVENTGEPLPGEAAAFRETNERRLVLAVAASLGIRTDYAGQHVRVYEP